MCFSPIVISSSIRDIVVQTSEQINNLGILFIIQDCFPNELLWRTWLSSFSEDNDVSSSSPRVKIWFHAKDPSKLSTWVRERLVSFKWFPTWGSLELTKVMVGMLYEVSLTSSFFLFFFFLFLSFVHLIHFCIVPFFSFVFCF
jgi:hypothetical protein